MGVSWICGGGDIRISLHLGKYQHFKAIEGRFPIKVAGVSLGMCSFHKLKLRTSEGILTQLGSEFITFEKQIQYFLMQYDL